MDHDIIILITRLENDIAAAFFIWVLIYIALKVWELTKDDKND